MRNIKILSLVAFIMTASQTGYSAQPDQDITPVITRVKARVIQCEKDLNEAMGEIITLNKSQEEKQTAIINPLIEHVWVAQTICKYERQIWEIMSLLNQQEGASDQYLSYRSKMMQDSLKLIEIRLRLVKTRIKEIVATRDIFQAYENGITTLASVKERFATSIRELEKRIPASDEKQKDLH